MHQLQEEELFILGETHFARIGKHYVGVAIAIRHIVDHHVVHHAGFAVLLLYKEVIALNLVVECLLWNIKFGRFLAHREQKAPHFHLRLGQDIILEEKGTHRNE